MQIKSYILTIISVVVFTLFAESIMPDGSMKKHISIVMGIVILITVAKPIIDFTGDLFHNGYDISLYKAEETTNSLIPEFEKSVAESVYNGFQTKLNALAEEKIYNQFNIKCKVESAMDEGVVRYIKIQGSNDAKIKEYVENQLGIKCILGESGETNEIY